jgi:hypothetical protein
MTRRTQERLQSAAEKADEHRDSIEELGEELTEALEDIWSRWEATAGEVEPIEVPLERTDVRLDHMLLFWAARK